MTGRKPAKRLFGEQPVVEPAAQPAVEHLPTEDALYKRYVALSDWAKVNRPTEPIAAKRLFPEESLITTIEKTMAPWYPWMEASDGSRDLTQDQVPQRPRKPKSLNLIEQYQSNNSGSPGPAGSQGPSTRAKPRVVADQAGYSKPLSAPLPPRKLKIGQVEVKNLPQLLQEAYAIDDRMKGVTDFEARLRHCAGLKPVEWINWSNDRLEALRVATQSQMNISTQYKDLNVADWCDQARTQASKKPGFFSMLRPNVTPEFYDAQLLRIRSELETLSHQATQAKEALRAKMDDLEIDNVIFQVVSKHAMNDPSASQAADAKMRAIIQGMQLGLMATQALDTSLSMMLHNIQQIDQVRTNVIPAWRLARS